MKKKFKVNGWYSESFFEAPTSRLVKILSKGDRIIGSENKFNVSASYVAYTVTHVDHWGVYAVPTLEMIERLKNNRTEEYVRNMHKGHIKFKWEHITAIQLMEGDN